MLENSYQAGSVMGEADTEEESFGLGTPLPLSRGFSLFSTDPYRVLRRTSSCWPLQLAKLVSSFNLRNLPDRLQHKVE